MRQGGNIKRLTGITVMMLTGIVVLQFYWLLSSYKQQQQRFYTDIDNALASVSARLLLDKALASQPESVRKMFGLEDTTGSQVKEKLIEEPQAGNMLHLVNSVVKVSDSNALRSMKAFLDSGSTETTQYTRLMQLRITFTDSDLVVFKKAYNRELLTRHIDMPFDLAIVDTASSIYAATCDTARFRQYGHRSSFSELTAINGAYGIVTGFQNPNYIVLRSMLWILVITMTLIIAGSWSLGYLLITFFRQGRIAEIRNDFMNNMTHELKTPISSISLALEMALDERPELSTGKKTSYLLSAQKEVTRLKLIVENVLKIASLEQAELDIIRSEIEVRPWLQAIIERMHPLLEQKNVTVRLEVTPADMVLSADETHMSNVIFNILENAIKYNDKATPSITVTVEARETYTLMSIRDNGEGIPEKYLEQVFEKFFRVPKGNQHDVKGYGLGLSYVKHVVELHGGSISVHSIMGKETAFILHLPL